MLTKENFTRDEWNHLLCLFNISHLSSGECSEAMAKRVQQESGEETVAAKSRPMMNLMLSRLELFQGSDFAGNLEDSKSTSGGVLCIFGSRTCVPISWMCKKQTAVSHSSTESEIISLDAG